MRLVKKVCPVLAWTWQHQQNGYTMWVVKPFLRQLEEGQPNQDSEQPTPSIVGGGAAFFRRRCFTNGGLVLPPTPPTQAPFPLPEDSDLNRASLHDGVAPELARHRPRHSAGNMARARVGNIVLHIAAGESKSKAKAKAPFPAPAPAFAAAKR